MGEQAPRDIKTVSGGNADHAGAPGFAANGWRWFLLAGCETLRPSLRQDVVSAQPSTSGRLKPPARSPSARSGTTRRTPARSACSDLLESRITHGRVEHLTNLICHQPLQRRHRQWWQGNRRQGLAKQVATDHDDRRPRRHRPCDVAVLAQQGIQGDHHGRRCDDLGQHRRLHERALGAEAR